ncbi:MULTISPECIES: ABC transporter ATP-binding protein [Fictibacillus]|uniref:ABC transporter ATP-binding protein n=1 Tax=Fictibacillus TaxID=1329200 RepID=UPI0018CF60D9|nr:MULTISPECIES: ABC transporter ATP-binding protein [unclassified Fictibacillus]MBH0157942.1 ABC transporter ATP-binding protein [Fictibacillus sp. 5RED26]MBH0163545.1 ABC transporter ATP-binding protein [Fictibacillus sp. 7GRE50]MBH0175919.1 ABC transporter ATP-binding protein [Fictibacillus sp. 23RED33]
MFVQIKDLAFHYKNSRNPLFENLSLNFNQGEVSVILGESGSGKSTLLRLIAGLEVPSRGSILIDQAVMNDTFRFVQPEKRGVGLVFQDYALFPHMTVEKNIKFGLTKMNRKQKQARMEELLAIVGMEDYASRYPYELSGGQQQRVALARAMAPNPSLIMFDEPFSNLDSKLQLQIRDELQEILKRTGITSIFVTHDEEDARAIGDRIILMNNGKIQDEGRPEMVLKRNKEQLSLAYV